MSIKVGAEAGDQSTEDIIVVRGASAEVDRAVKEILKIVEDAKDDLILSSYVCLFYRLTVLIGSHDVSFDSRSGLKSTASTWDVSSAHKDQVSTSFARR